MSAARRGWWPWLTAILAVALAVRVVVVLTSPHFHTYNDSAQYDQDAVQLANHGDFPESAATFHGGPTAYRPPLFPGLLAIVYKLVGDANPQHRWEWGRLMEAVLGTIAVLLVALIVRRIWSERAALVTAAVTAVYPPLILAGSSLLSESVFIPCVLLSVWAALVYRDAPRLRWAALAGAGVALAALGRGNGLELIIPVGFLLWVRRPRLSLAAVRAPLVAVVAMILVLTPWTIRNYDEFHQFVPVTTEAGYGLAGTYSAAAQDDRRYPVLWATPLLQLYRAFKANPQINEEQASDQLTKDGLHYIEHHPVSIPRTLYWNTVRDFDLTPGIERWLAPFEGYPTWLAVLSAYSFWVLTVLCLAALGLAAWRGRGTSRSDRAGDRTLALGRAPLALWGVPLVVYLTTVPLLGLTRYRVPADPFLLMPAGLLLLSAWDGVAGHRRALIRQRA